MRVALVMGIMVLFGSGCSSLSKEECAVQNWSMIGMSHGLKGMEMGRGVDIVSSCHEFGYRVAMEEYASGYKQGLKTYCEPENGFTVGLNGHDYTGVCNSQAFRLAWEQGRDRYRLERREHEIRERMEQIHSRLADIRHRLNEKELERGERRELESERRHLRHERSELQKERTLMSVMQHQP